MPRRPLPQPISTRRRGRSQDLGGDAVEDRVHRRVRTGPAGVAVDPVAKCTPHPVPPLLPDLAGVDRIPDRALALEQRALEVGLNRLGRRLARDDVCDELHVLGAAASDHGAVLDQAAFHQRGLQVSQLHAMSSELYLFVEPAQAIRVSARQDAGEVAGAVVARRLSTGKAQRHEPLARELRLPQVPAGQPVAAGVELARHTQGRRLQVAVEDVQLVLAIGLPIETGSLGEIRFTEE
jgi:hypothetical protein